MRQTTSWVWLRRTGALAFTTMLLLAADAGAQDETAAKVTITGKTTGGRHLLNPVWEEARDPKNHRYTFRVPSPTVKQDTRTLRASIPREVVIVALQEGAAAKGAPVQVHLSGGRTTPSTIVIPEGQNIQFINHDPFSHKLYDTKGVAQGMGPEKTKPGAQRTWRPPGVGTFEIRDKVTPSVRTWVVVEPKAAGYASPKADGTWTLPDLLPGEYSLQAYHAGKPTGDAMPLVVRPIPAVQPVLNPVNLGKAAKKD